MSKIAFNYSPLYARHYGLSHQTGIYRYSYELLKALLPTSKHQISFVRLQEPLQDQYDLYHSLFHYYAVPFSVHQQTHAQKVVTIHDLIPWLFPEFYPLYALDALKLYPALKQQWIISPSESTKQDLIRLSSLSADQIFVTPLAASRARFYPNPSSAIFEKYKVPKAPFFFFAGRLEPRKGIHLLLKAFRQFVQQQKVEDVNLVLAGQVHKRYADLLYTYQHEIIDSGLQSRVFNLSFIDDEDLSAFYSNALAHVYLSHYEGFGLPILEAMQCGTPSICLNNSSIPEVAGDAAHLLKEPHLDEIAQALYVFYEQKSFVDKLSQKGLKRSLLFSWEKTANKTLQAYETILNSRLSCSLKDFEYKDERNPSPNP